MEIRTVQSPAEWDKLILGLSPTASFLQSYAWGEVLAVEGKSLERVAVLESGEPKLAAQLVFSSVPGVGRYAFCPGGPVARPDFWLGALEPLGSLAAWVKNQKGVFLRFEPSANPPASLNSQPFKLAPTIDITPRATTTLDLAKDAEALLAAMHEKTRYNIRLAEKKNLRLSAGKDGAVFWELIRATGERDKFRLHERAHYEAVLAAPLSRQLTLFTDEGRPVATGIWFGFGKIFTYLFGASCYPLRHLMAPYRLQWEAIKLGQRLGFATYDFFGITPPSTASDQRHQYAGVTRFKTGFGGRALERPGTFDLIISPWKYKMYKILRSVRRSLPAP